MAQSQLVGSWGPPSLKSRLTSTSGHAVGGHGRAAHGFEAVVSVVGTHVALQSLGCGP